MTQFAAPPDSSEFELDDEPLHGPGPQGKEELDSPLHNNLSGGYPPSPSGTSLTENPVRAALGLLIKETPVSTSHSIGLDEFSVPALRQLTACELIERVIGLGSSASQILYGSEKPLIAFVSPIGTSLGTSIVSFLVEWGVYPHKDCASGLSDHYYTRSSHSPSRPPLVPSVEPVPELWCRSRAVEVLRATKATRRCQLNSRLITLAFP